MTPPLEYLSGPSATEAATALATRMLIEPCGGSLVNRILSEAERNEQFSRIHSLPSIQISAQTLCDLERIATGVFSPLDRFMGHADVESVRDRIRLANGHLFPIPITLPIDDPNGVVAGSELVLRSATNQPIAILAVDEVFEATPGQFCAAGPFQVLDLPARHDFPALRLAPVQIRERLRQRGNSDVVAFQTKTPLLRAHEEFGKQIAGLSGATLLVQALADEDGASSESHFTLIRCCFTVVDKYMDPRDGMFSVMPWTRHSDPVREAVLQLISARNCGANRAVLPAATRGPLQPYADELSVSLVPYEETSYSPDQIAELGVRAASDTNVITAAIDTMTAEGRDLPDWLIRPEVAKILSVSRPPRQQQGFCIWLTGLPSAGKSTIANIVTVQLKECGRQVTLLDGDVVRTHLSKGLGFTREDRDTNILRIGFVAAEIVRHNGVVICAAVSPYRETRDRVREMVGTEHFIEVFVDTPVTVCEQRDVKGYYAKARAGGLQGFTGVDDPYEEPLDPEIKLSTTEGGPAMSARVVMRGLATLGFVKD